MAKDFLDELGELALGSRLKRLSERMMADAASVYAHFDMPIQPKWFTLLAYLHQYKSASVVEAAEALGLSQPAISQFSRQLASLGLIDMSLSDQDGRKKIMLLTEKGNAQVEKMLPVWAAVEQAAISLCTELDNDFYQSLCRYEQALNRRSLLQRTLEVYDDAK